MMCYCIIKVRNAYGKEINAGLKLDESLENEQELRDMAESCNELLSACEGKCSRYCKCTIEIQLNEESLVPQTTINVPIKLAGELRKFLFRIQDFCDEHRKMVLGNAAKEQRGLLFTPAFFRGEVYEVVN